MGNGCVGDARSPGTSDCRDRSLFDRPDRLARHTVEREHEALFCYLCDRLDPLAVNRDIEEIRRCRQVVIPETVVHELVVPDPLARLDIEAHKRFREQIVAEADARRNSRVQPC